jgi:Xaa-Pro aminopeptidase
VVSALDEIAWLFNLRGADVSYNPVFYAFAVITEDTATLCVDLDKITGELRQEISKAISFAPYEALHEVLSRCDRHRPMLLDPATTSAAIHQKLQELDIPMLLENSPLPAWKAIKNASELQGMREAHVRDGVAMVRFFAWLERALASGRLDELSVADKLGEMRQQGQSYRGPSFGTISAYGPHGALPHYSSTKESNVPLQVPGIYLVDSGGQYDDGTTDITRTVALGTPSAYQKKIYTLVLKGHLNLKNSEFLAGTTGYQLDILARQPLWNASINYAHGTGHGVGAALCVHEGPFSVSLRKNLTPLEEGHVLSIEPGCYLVGEFGVRIENLAAVVRKRQTAFGDFLGFDDLTLCPYDRNLIDLTLVNAAEVAQINTYHERVHETLAPYLEGGDLEFLRRATAPLTL